MTGALATVEREPTMISFDLARVRQTLMRRRSLSRSPACELNKMWSDPV